MAVSSGGTYQAAQQSDKPADGKPRFKIKIFSPYQTYYQGEATSVSAANATGPFDVLPGHINFFSLLVAGTVTLNTGFQLLEFQVNRGIIRVNRDEVTVFADV